MVSTRLTKQWTTKSLFPPELASNPYQLASGGNDYIFIVTPTVAYCPVITSFVAEWEDKTPNTMSLIKLTCYLWDYLRDSCVSRCITSIFVPQLIGKKRGELRGAASSSVTAAGKVNVPHEPCE